MEELCGLYDLRDDFTIIIKGFDKGLIVVFWDSKDNFKEAYKQIEDRKVYEEVSNDPSVLVDTITKAFI